MTAVVIVNYGNPSLTIQFVRKQLSTLKESGCFIIIIVNNGATTETDEALAFSLNAVLVHHIEDSIKTEDRIFVLSSLENLGFAKGNNLAIEFLKLHFSINFILFTNNDIVIPNSDVLSLLKEKLSSNSKIGIIGPEVLGLDRERQSPEPYYPFWDKYILSPLGKHFLPNKKWRKRFKQDYSKNASEGFHYKLMGSFFLMRMEDFINCGGMDNKTFLYGEEVILTERLKLIDKYPYFYPVTSVIHHHGGTTKKSLSKRQIDMCVIESDCYYYRKYKKVSEISIAFVILIYKFIFKIKQLKKV